MVMTPSKPRTKLYKPRARFYGIISQWTNLNCCLFVCLFVVVVVVAVVVVLFGGGVYMGHTQIEPSKLCVKLSQLKCSKTNFIK